MGETNEFGMIKFLKNILGLGHPENRRKYDRYPIVTPIEVTVDGENFQCEVENVSAGGLRLTPALDAEVGATVTILYPKSGLSLEATVVGSDGSGTRARFLSDDAGTVVSIWVRMLNEEA
ncbi:MAG: PilZ domain-containing protein [Proteobacteria bacterium]|nr:PilZ domain-containing protein [Pseudomonadota bacterium]MDA1308665.1 PilZ domain-containing protein [Pseudomonadota bacterium]